MSLRGYHDMGGQAGDRVAPVEHDYALWEKRVDAMMVLLTSRGHMTVDELRRCIEGLGPEAYDRLTYYERWISSITQVMIERGQIGVAELAERIAKVKARGDAA